MDEQRHEQHPGLVDVIGLSLRDLAGLDDDLVGKVANRLLPDCGASAARIWQNNSGVRPVS